MLLRPAYVTTTPYVGIAAHESTTSVDSLWFSGCQTARLIIADLLSLAGGAGDAPAATLLTLSGFFQR